MPKDPASVVIDHTSYAVSETEGDHTLIASDDLIKSDVIVGSQKIEASNIFAYILKDDHVRRREMLNSFLFSYFRFCILPLY